jgi:hypothetical protein
MYQTDWNLASLQARVDGGAPFRLPMAILDNGEVRFWGGFGCPLLLQERLRTLAGVTTHCSALVCLTPLRESPMAILSLER